MISLKLKCLAIFHPGDFNRSNTCPLTTQTSGKRLFLCSKNGAKIYKPYPRRQPLAEEDFYAWVFNENRLRTTPDIKHFMPEFHGTLHTKNFSFVILENLTASFKCPSLIDVKIGAKTWSPTDCFLKVAKEKLLYPLGRTLGFRITGAKKYLNSTNSYKKMSFWTVRQLNAAGLRDKLLLPFFSYESGEIRTGVLKEVLKRLASIEEWFLSCNDRFQFCSSSLLIIFESCNEMVNEPTCQVDVRMIDFAHVIDKHQLQNQNTEQKISLDYNYLFGLRNFVYFISSLTAQSTSSSDSNFVDLSNSIC